MHFYIAKVKKIINPITFYSFSAEPNYLAIAVKDIDQTLKFYQKVFHMQVMYHQKNLLQLCTPGRNDILVFEEKIDASIGDSGGIAHFGFPLVNAKDIDIIVSKVIEAGGTIVDQGEFVKSSPYVFFKDPDGYKIEVWYELF